MTFEMRRKAGLLFFIYASNEPKSVLARDLGDRRDNLRNSWSVFLIVVLTATVIITCAGCLGGQQKYIGHSVLGGFSKVSQKAFSKVLPRFVPVRILLGSLKPTDGETAGPPETKPQLHLQESPESVPDPEGSIPTPVERASSFQYRKAP